MARAYPGQHGADENLVAATYQVTTYPGHDYADDLVPWRALLWSTCQPQPFLPVFQTSEQVAKAYSGSQSRDFYEGLAAGLMQAIMVVERLGQVEGRRDDADALIGALQAHLVPAADRVLEARSGDTRRLQDTQYQPRDRSKRKVAHDPRNDYDVSRLRPYVDWKPVRAPLHEDWTPDPGLDWDGN